MKINNANIKLFFYVCFCCLLEACSIHSPHAKTTIEAVEFLNPNIYHQASPVVVTIYQLKSQTAFEQANFFALNNNAQALLGSDLLDKRDIEIRPDQKQDLRIELSPSTSYIGVIAAFRSPDVAQWRQVKAVTPGSNTSFTIHLATQSVTIE